MDANGNILNQNSVIKYGSPLKQDKTCPSCGDVVNGDMNFAVNVEQKWNKLI